MRKRAKVKYDEWGTFYDPRDFHTFFLDLFATDMEVGTTLASKFNSRDFLGFGIVCTGVHKYMRTPHDKKSILISLHTRGYTKIPKRCCPIQVGYPEMMRVFRLLESAGWITITEGFHNRDEHDHGLRSTLTPTQLFLDWMDGRMVNPIDLRHDERIELRISGKSVSYKEDSRVRAMYRNLHTINVNNISHVYSYGSPSPFLVDPPSPIYNDILIPSLSIPPYRVPPCITIGLDPGYSNNNSKIHKPIFHRIFTESWNGHGRFYSPFQQLPKRVRMGMRIDGEPVVELDFKSLHPRLLYHMNGERCRDDLYDIAYPATYRPLIKQLMLIIFNCKSYRSAIGGLGQWMFEEKIPMPPIKLSEIIHRVEQVHNSISKYFYTSKGLELQNLDARIAEEIMLTFAKLQKPCLSVHDSFIVKQSDEQLLHQTMINAYKKILKTEFSPVISKDNR